jgi:general stress protein 26
MTTPPTTELDTRFSEAEASALDWSQATDVLAAAELSWISTVRPDGRPHVTPLITVLHDGVVFFCTGPEERKARNLRTNPAVVLTTGTNALHGGTDVVLEGIAERITDVSLLRELAEAWVAKYGEEWRFDVGPDAFNQHGGDGDAWVYAVRATQAFGFGKAPYSQTRWRF